MFRHVNMTTQSNLMTKMVAQLICGFSASDAQRLARLHERIHLQAEDFDHFADAMLVHICMHACMRYFVSVSKTLAHELFNTVSKMLAQLICMFSTSNARRHGSRAFP